MFNWVHTNFHYNPLKDRNASRKTNTKSMTKEVKRQGLGKQVDEIVDVLDDWSMNGRRLTIFLMGFERSSKPSNYKVEYFNLRKEGKRCEFVDNIVDNDDDDDDELSPLMATTFHNNFDDNGEFCTEFDKSQVVVAIERHVVAQRLGRRVTLADLFMADADGNPKPAPEKVVAQDLPTKLPKVETDGSSCFADKPKVVAAWPPARNLRRLMKKMMKRKIHAEVEQQQLLG